MKYSNFIENFQKQRTEKIIDFLTAENYVSTHDVAVGTEISDVTALSDLKKLKEQGMINGFENGKGKRKLRIWFKNIGGNEVIKNGK